MARFTCSRWRRWSSEAARDPARRRICARAARRRLGEASTCELLGGDAVESDLPREGGLQPALFPTPGEPDRDPHEHQQRQSFDRRRDRHHQPIGAGPGFGREEVEQRGVPQEVAEHRQGTQAGGDPQTTAQRFGGAARDHHPDGHAHQSGVEHVRVQPARHHPQEEPLQHAGRLAAEHAHEVEDVLDDREPQAAHGPVDEPVHHVVDLVARDQVDQHHAAALQGLLDERRGERGGPARRELGSSHPGDREPPSEVADRRQRGGRDRAPHQGRGDQRQRLALVEVQEVDDQEHRQGVEGQQQPGQRPPRGGDVPIEALLGERHQAGRHDDQHVQPERRLTRLEEPHVMQARTPEPSAGGHGHGSGHLGLIDHRVDVAVDERERAFGAEPDEDHAPARGIDHGGDLAFDRPSGLRVDTDEGEPARPGCRRPAPPAPIGPRPSAA